MLLPGYRLAAQQARHHHELECSPEDQESYEAQVVLLDETNKIIAKVFGQEIEEMKDNAENSPEGSVQEDGGK